MAQNKLVKSMSQNLLNRTLFAMLALERAVPFLIVVLSPMSSLLIIATSYTALR